MNHSQLVLVEFRNCGPMVYRVVSDKPITMESVVKYFIDDWDFNEERDSLTILDEVTTINLDNSDLI